MTAYQQTRLTWARVIENHDDVPEVFRAIFMPLLERAGDFPYAVLAPSHRQLREAGLESLLFCIGRQLFVLQNVDGAVRCTEYSLDQINYAEVWTILLSSWFKISGISTSGALVVTAVQLNTVTLPLIEPFLNQIRPTCQALVHDLAAERSKFDVLAHSHYKYMTAGRNSLRQGDAVIQYVLQPEIHATLLSRLLGNYVPTHIIILTEGELILIRDHLAHWWNPQERYGNVFHYVGLKNITHLSLVERADGLLDFSIHLPGDDRLQQRFHPSKRAELEQMMDFHA